jgi:ribosome biogenesis GTPase
MTEPVQCERTEGLVIKTTGQLYFVMQKNGVVRECILKGIFRIRGHKATNPVIVGDNVDFEFMGDNKTGTITRIHERKNYIIRKATNLSKLTHIIAANIDRAYLIVTLAQPRTSTGFIDRFLVTAEAYHIPATIVFNKTDIYKEEQLQHLSNLCALYEKIGYPCICTSALTGGNIPELRKMMAGKVNLFSGHSGVGKSAIINALEPSLKIKTGQISDYHLKGKHTTTFAEMHPLPGGGFIIDTPGIKEFGLIDFRKNDLTHFFPEFFNLLNECKFYNCTHINEPECAVKQALDEGRVSLSRYQNYLNIFYGRDVEEKEWDLR